MQIFWHILGQFLPENPSCAGLVGLFFGGKVAGGEKVD
jgi:hypothetical protein